MKQRVLVTGATGLVGNNVTRLLLEQGIRLRVLVRDRETPPSLRDLDVEMVRGDVSRPDCLPDALRGIDCVIHAAGFVHLGRSQWETHRAVNVDGTRHVAQAALAAGARMIHISSCDALGVRSLAEPADEDTPLKSPIRCNYVLSKRAAEQQVCALLPQGLDAVIVNPGFMLGPWDWKPSSGRMLLEVARGRAMFAPRGHFSVCDVRDVAQAIIAAMDRGQIGRRYILAGQTMSYIDAWRLFARVTGGRCPLGRPGPVLLWLAGQFGDLCWRVTGKEPDVNSGAIALARLPKNYSSQRAIDELGYSIRPFEQSARDAWDWFVSHGYAQRR